MNLTSSNETFHNHLQSQTDFALKLLRRAPGARRRRVIVRQLELVLNLTEASVALHSGQTSNGLTVQQRALCMAPVCALEPETDLAAVRRYVHACLLGAPLVVLTELARVTGSDELAIRLQKVSRPKAPRRWAEQLVLIPSNVARAA